MSEAGRPALFGPAALAYLPAKAVEFELVEFWSEGKVVQGGVFSPVPKRFAKPATAVVLVHGVELYCVCRAADVPGIASQSLVTRPWVITACTP